MLRSIRRVTPRHRAVLACAQHASRRLLSTDIAAAAQEEVADLIARSRAAQAEIADYTQEQVDDLITAMVYSVCQEDTAKMIAQHTVDETRLGNYDGKFLKIHRKTRAALMDIIEDKSVGVIEEIPERAIVKIAKPVGVIGALSPSTNPEATPVIKGINAIKGRNSIVIAPHPRAAKTNALIVELMRGALTKMGAPPDLVLGIDTPSVGKTNELMKQCDRVLATGGAPMVSAAYSSGTPALGVGAGNCVTTVDETADLEEAADKIVLSKTLDLAASCSADNSVLLVASVYDEMLAKLVQRGGFVLGGADKAKLQATLWVDGHLNAKVVAQTPQFIAEAAGFDVPSDCKFFIVPETGYGKAHPFSGEKMSVTMALYRVDNIDAAVEMTNAIQAYQGQGHSCGIYTKNDDHVMKLALATKTSRLLVCQPQAASNSGNLWNGLRQTFSLGCGSWGGTSICDNINWRHLVNETWVSRNLPKPKELWTDEQLFGRIKGKMF
jgi:sulfoacetaldehyde dehydrogenase